MPVTVQQLGPQDSEALKALLGKDPSHNLYLLGLLEEFGIAPTDSRCSYSFWGRFDGKALGRAGGALGG
jgi:uncharacterized protein